MSTGKLQKSLKNATNAIRAYRNSEPYKISKRAQTARVGWIRPSQIALRVKKEDVAIEKDVAIKGINPASFSKRKVIL